MKHDVIHYVRQIFLWSWVITVPISLLGGYLLYRAADRTYTYNVRYESPAKELQFDRIARYEASQLANFARVKFLQGLGNQGTSLRSLILLSPKRTVLSWSPICRNLGLSTWEVGLFGTAN